MSEKAKIHWHDAATLLINGEWLTADNAMDIFNPFNEQYLTRVACADTHHVQLAVAAAKAAYIKNRHTPSHERARILHGAAKVISERHDEFAHTIACETGKPITAARKEVSRCINTLTLSAEEATRLHGETIQFDSFAGGEQRIGHYDYVPLGVVVAITPFNDPLNLAAHKLGPAIAAGNAIILKPSQQAPLSALKLVEALIEAGLPDGQVNVLTGYAREFAKPLVSHPDVAMVTYTGGEASGEIIARDAGIKKLAMELGANSPVIVLDDCNLEQAVSASVSGSFWAVGQNCIGVQRIYVQEGIYEKFKALFVEQTNALVVGDQLDDRTDIGPMINENEAKRVEQWVKQALDDGATLLAGGKRENACFYPSVMENVASNQKLVCQEVFGPVVSLFKFNSLEDTIALANDADFTIHGAVFTSNINTAIAVFKALDVAGVMINDSTDYRLDAMPFGGAKRGSLGREGVKFAIREMSQTKVVCINLAQ